jgi:hypothetical protein
MCEKCKPLIAAGLYVRPMKLAGGNDVVYYYVSRDKGAPRITAAHASAAFAAEFWHLLAQKKAPSKGRFQEWIDVYFKSGAFRDDLAERTKLDYVACQPHIEKEFGKAPVTLFERGAMRGAIRQWRDRLVDQIGARWAEMCHSVLSAILTLAYDDGRLEARNPCHGRKRKAYHGNRRDKIWSIDAEEAYMAAAPDHMQEAMILALWTGQRQGDQVRLKLNQYDAQTDDPDEGRLNLVQGKSKRKGVDPVYVSIPVRGQLKAMLDAKKARYGDDTHILLDSDGKPWKLGKKGADAFRQAFKRVMAAAGLVRPRGHEDHITFSDLRGTACTRLALAGVKDRAIAMITGHSLKQINSILDANYIKRDDEMARDAIEKLERDMMKRLKLRAKHEPAVGNVVKLKVVRRRKPAEPRAKTEREIAAAKRKARVGALAAGQSVRNLRTRAGDRRTR